MKRSLLPSIIVATTALVAALDFWASADLMAPILFMLPLALCAVQGSKRLLWGTASSVVLLMVVKAVWGLDHRALESAGVATVNHALRALSVLTLSSFIHLSIGKTRRLVSAATHIAQQATHLRAQNEQLEVLVAAAARDLGVLREAEAHLAQAERRYRGLLEAAPDGIVVVDEAGLIVLLNVQANKQFGYSPGELAGRRVTTIIPEGFAERLVADGSRTAAETVAQQIGNGIELVGLRRDGSAFPIEIMLSPLLGEDGMLVTAAVRDISARKRAEIHLAQMEARYRGLLEAAPDAMVLVSQDGRIVLVNLQAEKQFGYRRGELVGHPVASIIPEGLAERLLADALRAAEDPEAQPLRTEMELDGRRKDGSQFPIEIMMSPLDSAEGRLVTVAMRNITVRQRAEALLLEKNQELKRSNEELGQFAYLASHDLQEPLRMVASYTQLLSRRYKGKLDADADEFIGFAVDGANRMQRLIQDLLAYSRVGSSGHLMVGTASDRALQHAIANLGSAIEDSGALVTHEPLPSVMADEGQLTQLFQNLVGNAIKYQGSGAPRVHIGATESAGKWIFSVRDNGLGIDPQYHERIFGMFQRLHRREEFAGTGMGLAICKKIVERHGGCLSVESELGQGSTFRFALKASELVA